jgi:hypothetical protein
MPKSVPTPTPGVPTKTPEPRVDQAAPADDQPQGEPGWPPAAYVPPEEATYVAPTLDVRFASYCQTSPLYPPGSEIVLPRSVALLVERPGFGPSNEPVDPPDTYDPIVARFRPTDSIPSGAVIEITGPHVETGTCDVWPIRYYQGFGSVIEGFIDERELRPAA